MPYKIYNIHPVDTLIPKLKPILRSPRIKKFGENQRKVSYVTLNTEQREKKKKKNFQLELNKALEQHGRSWLA